MQFGAKIQKTAVINEKNKLIINNCDTRLNENYYLYAQNKLKDSRGITKCR